MKKVLLVPGLLFAAVTLGVVFHDILAVVMVEQGVAGALLGAGAGGHPPEAVLALVFVALRLFGLPLAGAAVVGATVHAATALISRRRAKG